MGAFQELDQSVENQIIHYEYQGEDAYIASYNRLALEAMETAKSDAITSIGAVPIKLRGTRERPSRQQQAKFREIAGNTKRAISILQTMIGLHRPTSAAPPRAEIKVFVVHGRSNGPREAVLGC